MSGKRRVRRSPKRRKQASVDSKHGRAPKKRTVGPTRTGHRKRKLTPAERQRQEETRFRGLHALRLMRRGESLKAAAQKAATTPRTVRKYTQAGMRKRAGHWQAIPVDELRRPLKVLTDRGIIVLDVRSSKTASRIAEYWNAVDHYLRTGDRRPLEPFQGQRFRAQGHLFPFITDPRLLDRLAAAGQVTFEDLYETAA